MYDKQEGVLGERFLFDLILLIFFFFFPASCLGNEILYVIEAFISTLVWSHAEKTICLLPQLNVPLRLNVPLPSQLFVYLVPTQLVFRKWHKGVSWNQNVRVGGKFVCHCLVTCQDKITWFYTHAHAGPMGIQLLSGTAAKHKNIKRERKPPTINEG